MLQIVAQETLPEPIECPICFEEVTIPYWTECKHQFCYSCFLKLKTQANTLTCPTCRKEQSFSSIKLVQSENQLLKNVLNLNYDFLTLLRLDPNLWPKFYSPVLQCMCASSNQKTDPYRIQFYKEILTCFPCHAQKEFEACNMLSTPMNQYVYRSEWIWYLKMADSTGFCTRSMASRILWDNFSCLQEWVAPTIKLLGLNSGVHESISKYNSTETRYCKMHFVGFNPVSTTVTLENDMILNLLQFHIYNCGEIMFEKYMSQQNLILIAKAVLSLDAGMKHSTPNDNIDRLDLLFHEFKDTSNEVVSQVFKLRTMIPEFELLEFNIKHVASLVKQAGHVSQEDLIAKLSFDMSLEEIFLAIGNLTSHFDDFRILMTQNGNFQYVVVPT